jgi:hypothetical protein
VNSAAAFLIGRSLANATRRRLQRLKEPRYAIGAVFGALYFFSIAMRPRLGAHGHPLSPSDAVDPALSTMAGLGVFVAMFLNLLFGSSETLRFSPAEVDLLFTAPLTRRQLVTYKLASVQPALIFSAALSMILGFQRVSGGHILTRWIGLWIIYSTMHLHFTAVAFVRRSLADHGMTGVRRRMLFLAIAAAVIVAVAASAAASFPRVLQDLGGPNESRNAALRDVLRTPALVVLLWVPNALVGPAVAPSAMDFVHRLPAALLVFGLHYAWVIVSDASFEEVAAEAAFKRASRARDAAALGRPPPVVPTGRAFFPLAPRGSPAFALAWKNLVALVRLGISPRVWIMLVALLVTLVVASFSERRHQSMSTATGTLLLTIAGFATVLGPVLVRFDLRRDLSMLDVLKVVPLRGAEIVAGEMLASAAVISATSASLLTAGYVTLRAGGATDAPSIPIFLSLLILTVPIVGVLLLVQNAAALFFPAWVATGPDRTSGFEVLGQRLVWMLGTLVGAGIVLLPAALAAGLGYGLLRSVAGDAAYVPAALVAACVIAGEASVAILWLGRLFEKLDPSSAGIA